MKAYLYLFIKSRKNYFFERFKFLNQTKLNKWYISLFFLKNIFINILIYVFLMKFPAFKSIIVCVPFFILFSKLMGLDSKKWSHFYRNDWLLSLPNDAERYFKILGSHLVVDFFIEDNIVLYFIIQLQYLDFNYLIICYCILLVIYVVILSFYLVLIQSNVWLKKIYSFISYIISSFGTAIIFYAVIRIIISIIMLILMEQDVLLKIIEKIEKYIITSQTLLLDNSIIIYSVISVIFVLNLLFMYRCLIKNYFENGKQGIDAKMSDLLFVRYYYNFFSFFFKKNSEHMKKELALIVHQYSFNFREYLNTFLIDRSIFVLLGMFACVYPFKLANAQYIVALLSILFFYIDISSGVNIKLLANMSFISDYYTIQMYNIMNIPLKNLIKEKIKFFRMIRMPSLISYIILITFCSSIFNFSILTFSLIVVTILCFWIYLPYVMITNNLIYVRPNYEKLSKYIEEYTVLTREIKDFILIEIGYRILVLSVVIGIAISLMFSDVFYLYVIINVIILMVVLVLTMLMSRVRNNICNSLEMGDYSVDISKIFKK